MITFSSFKSLFKVMPKQLFFENKHILVENNTKVQQG